MKKVFSFGDFLYAACTGISIGTFISAIGFMAIGGMVLPCAVVALASLMGCYAGYKVRKEEK